MLRQVGILVADCLEYLGMVVNGALHQRVIICALLNAAGYELLNGVAHGLRRNAQERVAAGIGNNIMEIQVGLAEGFLALRPGRPHPGHGLFQLQQVGFGTPRCSQRIGR